MENDIIFNSISAIDCDGINVNTGTKGRIIKLLKKSVGQPLHWFVDVKTSGPHCYTRPIGKLLAQDL